MAKQRTPVDPNVGLNIKALMEAVPALGSQPALARATSLAQSTIGRIIRSEGNATGENLKRIAQAFNINVGTLYYKHERFAGLLLEGRLKELTEETADNVTDVPRPKRVPLISWIQAGEMSDIEDYHLPPDHYEWVEVYETEASDPSFALKVQGDSMTSSIPGEISFPSGTIIIVDPTTGGDAGDFVVAKDTQTQKATFKKLVTDGSRWYLKPLNTSYPTIEIDDPQLHIIGKVIQYQIRGTL